MSRQKSGLAGDYTWVLVADASRAQIYSRHKRRSPLEIVQSLTEAQARAREQDLVADKPGRTFDRAGQGRHAMEPAHTEKEHLRTQFAQRITKELESARNEGRFKQLVIIATPAMLGELRGQFHEATAACIVAEFNKELTGYEPEVVAQLIDAQS
jgi:protein required for attachment to host cells